MKFLDDLAARRRFGVRPGLDQIRTLCHSLGDPQNDFSAVHVAGTNGKGAVCAILAACLPGRVGRYTSPHLVRLNERFCLDNAFAADDTLDRLAARVAALAPPDLTFFEALTAVAFLLYSENRVDHAVLECGLGGRLDATNICRPELSVITRIGLDHCDWLGDTIEKIAAEKAGIIKPGVPVVLARNDPAVRAVVEARAHELSAPFYYAPDLASESEIPTDFSLEGSFNRENAQTALAALKVLGFAAPENLRGFSRVSWPGRFQRLGSFLVDGAHNPPAARALAASLPPVEGGYDLIAGFCGDKDVHEVLRILAPHVRQATAVQTKNPRSLSAAETAERMLQVGMKAAPCPSLAQALALARQTNHPTLVCGSLFLAGEALVELGAAPTGRFDPSESMRMSK